MSDAPQKKSGRSGNTASDRPGTPAGTSPSPAMPPERVPETLERGEETGRTTTSNELENADANGTPEVDPHIECDVEIGMRDGYIFDLETELLEARRRLAEHEAEPPSVDVRSVEVCGRPVHCPRCGQPLLHDVELGRLMCPADNCRTLAIVRAEAVGRWEP